MRKIPGLSLLFTIILIGLSACSNFANAVTTQQCLIFKSLNNAASPMMMSCEGELSEIIRETHSVEDLAYSPSSGKIYFSGSVKDSTGLFTFNLKNEKVNDVNICPERDCTQIALDPTEKYLAYSTNGSGGQVVLTDLATRDAVLVENAPAGYMDFSPDGTHFRYYSLDTNTLNIIMLPDMRLIATVSCDADLIGSWRSITEFIFGARRSDGQIAQIDYWNYDLELQARQNIFIDLIDGVQIYRPIMIEDDMFAALVRTGYRENSRQIWLIDAMGNTLIEITADNRYDHANLDWSEKFEMLAYQRFALSGSDAAPEIWVWNRDTSLQALVTETAAQPEWLD